MKSGFIVLALVLGVASANADPRPLPKMGSRCGLVDSWEEVESTSTTFDLGRGVRRVKQLPKIVQAQLIAGANAYEERAAFSDAKEAAKMLWSISEENDLYIYRSRINGAYYSVISFYPGGNHYGFIFKWGTKQLAGRIGDDDIVCP